MTDGLNDPKAQVIAQLTLREPDYADLVRTGVWKASCKCWHLWEDFHRPGG